VLRRHLQPAARCACCPLPCCPARPPAPVTAAAAASLRCLLCRCRQHLRSCCSHRIRRHPADVCRQQARQLCRQRVQHLLLPRAQGGAQQLLNHLLVAALVGRLHLRQEGGRKGTVGVAQRALPVEMKPARPAAMRLHQRSGRVSERGRGPSERAARHPPARRA
jgi:hypothetical protein